jgi:hypothetical protein
MYDTINIITMRSFLKASCHKNCGSVVLNCGISGTPNIMRRHDIFKNCAAVMLVLINQEKSKSGLSWIAEEY